MRQNKSASYRGMCYTSGVKVGDVFKLQQWGGAILSSEEAFSILDTTELSSVNNFICVLHKCKKEKGLVNARLLHAHICNNGLEAHKDVGNYVVPMFVACGSLPDAQQVFSRLVYRNQHSWTSLLLGYVAAGHSQHALNLYHKMRVDSVNPNRHTLMALLKACAKLKNLERGREVHIEIIERGIDRNFFVGSTLVDMYAKCGSPAEAQEVFDKLRIRDTVSWNALLAGYAQYGPYEKVLGLFKQMQLDCIIPDAVTYVCALQACRSMRSIVKGREIHAQIAENGFESDPFVGNTLVDMYAKCGLLSDAHEVFDKLQVKDAISWTALIAGYVEHGPVQKALQNFEQMQIENVLPDAGTFVCVLKACGIIGAIEKGQQIHLKLRNDGFERDLLVGNALVDMYVKCGSLAQAQQVFDKLPVRNVVSWTSLIAGYAEHGPGEKALKCYQLMQLEGVSPNMVTFLCCLKACGSIQSIDKGQELHLEIRERGYQTELFMGNALVDMYAKCGSLLEAHEFLNEFPVRNVVSWNALLAGYAEHGPALEVFNCFEQMQQEGISPDEITYICILKACGNVGAIEKGRKIHLEIIQKGIDRDICVGNTLMGMYIKWGSLLEAKDVFDKLLVRDVVSWNILIAAYAEHGLGSEAVDCFDQMQMDGIAPDTVTFVCALKACGYTGAVQKGRAMHTEIAKQRFENDAYICSALVDMYAKCGSVFEAREVFDKSHARNVVVWNAMINGYVMNHDCRMAVQCFENLQKQDLKPDALTFTSLLTGCSRASLVVKGKEYFKMMEKEYGILPTNDHYTSIVDLLARSGHLHEAERFIESICYPPLEMWTALLTACKTYGEAEVGLRCFQKLVQRNPEKASAYVLMANIYANAGRMDDAHRIEQMRKLAGAKKMPAIASIEVNKKVHKFVIGSNQSKEISAMLEILNSCMKGEAHVPNLELVLRSISDEEKEASLCEHAEKLAIAFGLLNTLHGQTLHVTKNMRTCANCHNSSKTISRLERREIIVRDSCCVHHFKDGLCSCKVVF